MKLLHVISGLGTGGAESTLVQLAPALARRGWTQQVVGISEHDDNAQRLRAAGIDVTVLGLAGALGAPGGLLKLRHIVRAFTPDLLQGWMYHGDLLAALAHRSTRGADRRRLLWNLRASNMDADRYASIVRWCARLSRWPDVVVANSKAGANHHLAAGYRPRRLEIIPNGIDIDKFRPDENLRSAVRRELGIAADRTVAIHIARVDPMKDHACFVEVLRALPQIQGVLVGRGTESLAVPANARALGARQDLPRLYAAADIVVSTSVFGEGFSNVVAEGMSCGLVPVATRVGDAALIVGTAGHVLTPGDRDALAQALSTIAALPADERRSRRMAARERIVANFSLEAAVSAYAALYDSVTR